MAFEDAPSIGNAWTEHGIPVAIYNQQGEVYQHERELFFIRKKDYAVYLYGTIYSVDDVIINTPEAFLVSDKLILQNADDDSTYKIEDEINEDVLKIVLVSFNCLEQLNIFNDLKKGRLEVLDYTEEDRVNIPKKHFSDCENALYGDTKYERDASLKKIPKPPNRGYTLMIDSYNHQGFWHKSGTLLIRVRKKYYLMGQDEGQYFGLELPKAAETVLEAFDVLVPSEAKGCPRQGEWFVVPCKEPPRKNIVATFLASRDNDVCLVLPKEEPESNDHRIKAESAMIDNKGNIYAFEGFLCHDQHESIHFKKCVKFIKNTAVRSVSVDGVD